MDSAIQLVVGLGNPGADYVLTRHNAGFWFVDALARSVGASFSHERKFSGEVCRVQLDGHELRLLKPTTYMNRSGQSVQALAAYLKLPSSAILVAHDDLDLPFGTVRLKRGGGHGGHNGLRDISAHLGEDYYRLRFGIGRPDSQEVIDYVLKRASADEETQIMQAVEAAIAALPALLAGKTEHVMQQLHSRGVVPRNYRKDRKVTESDQEKQKT